MQICWCPSSIRAFVTNFLQTQQNTEGKRTPKIPVFEFLVHIVDLLEAHDDEELVSDHVEISSLPLAEEVTIVTNTGSLSVFSPLKGFSSMAPSVPTKYSSEGPVPLASNGPDCVSAVIPVVILVSSKSV